MAFSPVETFVWAFQRLFWQPCCAGLCRKQQSQDIENEGVEIAFWARDQTLMSIIMQQELYCAMVSRSAKVLFLLCLAANATQMEAVARVYKFLEEEQEFAVTIPIDSKSRNEIGPKVASKRFRAYLCHLGYSFYAEAKEYVLETYLTKRRADCLPALMI
ncbi:Uncharacterised protein [Porphyromonas crevioricanis]|uniref:Uncharacterized protein n=2 Tax=Porphyromonas crevioricanis TaxID=393921 RepID=A0A2X4PII2_9PORP|nr:hypothetical protein [Porphyromonas crevioricanis]SQH72480.1 Uncharacterised protein [Porphyromonas crevioricanis]